MEGRQETPNTKGGLGLRRLHTGMAGRNPAWHDNNPGISATAAAGDPPTPPEETGPQTKSCSWQRLPHTSIWTTPLLSGQLSKMGLK